MTHNEKNKMTKKCSKCGSEKTSERCWRYNKEWNINCRKCYDKHRDKISYLENPDYWKNKSKVYLLEHPDYKKVWYLEHPDYRKIRYLENREDELNYQKVWRANNPNYQKSWHACNPDYDKTWYLLNRERISERSWKRYQKRKAHALLFVKQLAVQKMKG